MVAIQSRESSVRSFILFRVLVFMSFSWEKILSTPVVYTGITLHICASVLIFGYKALGLVRRSCMTSLCFTCLKGTACSHFIPLSIHVGKQQFHLHDYSTVLLVFVLPYVIRLLESMGEVKHIKIDLSSNLPLIFYAIDK